MLAFLQGLWAQAWNAEYVGGDSGMALTPGSQPNAFTVTVYRGMDEIATGSYIEVIRLLTPEVGGWSDLPDDGPVSGELYVTAGMLQGLDGFATPAWGLARRVTITGDGGAPPQVVEGFTPVGIEPDLAFAIEGAAGLYDTMSGWAMLAGDEPYTTDPCGCQGIYDNDFDACVADALACDMGCAAAALLAVAGCLAAGPFMPICLALVIAAEGACVAACFASYEACKRRAKSSFIRCVNTCIDEQI